MSRIPSFARRTGTSLVLVALVSGCHGLVDAAAGSQCPTDDRTGPGWRDRGNIFYAAGSVDGDTVDPCSQFIGEACDNSFNGTCELDDICDSNEFKCRVSDAEAQKDCPAALRGKLEEPQNCDLDLLKVADVRYEFFSTSPQTCFRLELGLAGSEAGTGVEEDFEIVTDEHDAEDLIVTERRVVGEHDEEGPIIQFDICVAEGTPPAFTQLAVQTYADPDLLSNRTCGHEDQVVARPDIR